MEMLVEARYFSTLKDKGKHRIGNWRRSTKGTFSHLCRYKDPRFFLKSSIILDFYEKS